MKVTDPNLVELPTPEVPYTLIYGSYTKTDASYKLKDNPRKWTDKDEFVISNQDFNVIIYNGGDGTVTSMASLLPGLKWARKYTEGKTKYPVEIIGYCEDENYNNQKSNVTTENNSETNIYKTLKCRCGEPSAEECLNASMHGDKNIITSLQVTQ